MVQQFFNLVMLCILIGIVIFGMVMLLMLVAHKDDEEAVVMYITGFFTCAAGIGIYKLWPIIQKLAEELSK